MKGTFSFAAMLDLSLEEYLAFGVRFDMILNYDPQTNLLHNECSRHVVCHTKLQNMMVRSQKLPNYSNLA